MPRVEKKTELLWARVTPALLKKVDRDVAKGRGEESRGSIVRRALEFFFRYRECPMEHEVPK